MAGLGMDQDKEKGAWIRDDTGKRSAWQGGQVRYSENTSCRRSVHALVIRYSTSEFYQKFGAGDRTTDVQSVLCREDMLAG
jgi:hypothetical protein